MNQLTLVSDKKRHSFGGNLNANVNAVQTPPKNKEGTNTNNGNNKTNNQNMLVTTESKKEKNQMNMSMMVMNRKSLLMEDIPEKTTQSQFLKQILPKKQINKPIRPNLI